ncbi:MAG: hypothetical protein U1F36_00320 [Planctomycetota bacterium]
MAVDRTARDPWVIPRLWIVANLALAIAHDYVLEWLRAFPLDLLLLVLAVVVCVVAWARAKTWAQTGAVTLLMALGFAIHGTGIGDRFYLLLEGARLRASMQVALAGPAPVPGSDEGSWNAEVVVDRRDSPPVRGAYCLYRDREHAEGLAFDPTGRIATESPGSNRDWFGYESLRHVAGPWYRFE